jgi:membrane associated rhomboid family serine protease
MFIPLRHESNTGRRWPVITIGIVLLNIIVFLCTHWRMDTEAPELSTVRAHLVLLAASHPELTVPDSVQDFLNTYKRDNPDLWSQAASPERDVADAWDARVRAFYEPDQLQQEMDSLAEQFTSLSHTSILTQYGFVPAHPSAMSYVTANFLHGGWLHLFFNMWFLWLAGAILEDTWGRVIYPIFYLLAGAAALQFYAWVNSGGSVPLVGASGAIAALMGAFLCRFATTKIEIGVFFGPRSLARLTLGEGIRFKAASYWLLPLWLLMEIFYGALSGRLSNVAHWAHVGGFLFGVAFALGLRYSGLEHRADQAIEQKVTWTADAGYVQVCEQMEQGNLDQALASLNTYLASNANSVEGYTLLHQLLWRKNDVPGYRNAVVKLCQLLIQANDIGAALQNYEEFTNSGGELFPASPWLALCRAFEGQGNLDRALSEYERLAAAYPAERQSILALLAAARLCLKRLNRPSDALRLYKAASASSVPHLDSEASIQAGIKEAEQALTVGVAGA